MACVGFRTGLEVGQLGGLTVTTWLLFACAPPSAFTDHLYGADVRPLPP